MSEQTGCWVAYTTVESKAKAEGLACWMVKEGMVACVNIVGPVESVYAWQGKIEQTTEWMLMLKCSKKQREKLKAELPDMHEYKVPELVFLEVLDGHEPYLQWIRQSGANA